MQAGAAAAVLAASLMLASPVMAAPSPYDLAFVSAFADACVVHRTDFEATKTALAGDGWTVTTADADPELKALMGFSQQAMDGITANGGTIDFALFSKPLDGAPHYVVVSNAQFTKDGKPHHFVGCYLYNFAATTAVDPEAVGALLGEPVQSQQVDADITSYQWAPPPKLPGTLDVYLTFVPDSSQYKAQAGFSGLVLQFNTELAAGAN